MRQPRRPQPLVCLTTGRQHLNTQAIAFAPVDVGRCNATRTKTCLTSRVWQDYYSAADDQSVGALEASYGDPRESRIKPGNRLHIYTYKLVHRVPWLDFEREIAVVSQAVTTTRTPARGRPRRPNPPMAVRFVATEILSSADGLSHACGREEALSGSFLGREGPQKSTPYPGFKLEFKKTHLKSKNST